MVLGRTTRIYGVLRSFGGCKAWCRSEAHKLPALSEDTYQRLRREYVALCWKTKTTKTRVDCLVVHKANKSQKFVPSLPGQVQDDLKL